MKLIYITGMLKIIMKTGPGIHSDWFKNHFPSGIQMLIVFYHSVIHGLGFFICFILNKCSALIIVIVHQVLLSPTLKNWHAPPRTIKLYIVITLVLLWSRGCC